MDYRLLAQEELRAFNTLGAAYENTESELEEIKTRSLCLSGEDTEESGTLEAAKERLRLRLHELRLRRQRIERALSLLSGEEQRILTAAFGGRDIKPEDVMFEIGIEKSSFYRIRGDALERFTRALYGVVIT